MIGTRCATWALGHPTATAGVLHFLFDFGKSFLLVLRALVVHFVDTDNQLLDAEKVQKQGVLPGLALHLRRLVVSLLDGCRKIPVRGNHQNGDIGLRRTGNHVLDEILVARTVDDRVVVLVRKKLLRSGLDRNAPVPLFLLAVHKEGEGKGSLSEARGFLAQLVHFTFRNSAQLVNQPTGSRAFPRVHVTANRD
jgi:hypothetical protein